MTAQVFTIAEPTLDDVPELDAMWAQSWMDTYPNDEFGVSREWVESRIGKGRREERIAKRREQILKDKDNPNTHWRIAKNRGGRIIGVIAPHRDKSVQRVGAMYVDKSYHGKGVAQALMEEILAWADPARPLELEVATYNERAKAFYRKYGFEEVKNSEHLVHDTLPVVTMIRKGDQ